MSSITSLEDLAIEYYTRCEEYSDRMYAHVRATGGNLYTLSEGEEEAIYTYSKAIFNELTSRCGDPIELHIGLLSYLRRYR